MKLKILTLIASFSLLFGFGLAISASSLSYAQQKDELCSGANLNLNGGNNADCGGRQPQNKLNSLIETIVNVITVIVGIVAVIMIIYGGFRYITSGGETAGVAAAKNTIIYAIVGLIIVAMAQIIVKFIIGKI